MSDDVQAAEAVDIPEAEVSAEERPAHENEDQGGTQILQVWRTGEDNPVRFSAFCLGLGAHGSKGRYRLTRDYPWTDAVVDAVVSHPDGVIYCIHV